MLNLIGTGVSCDLTKKGTKKVQESDKIYLERYTSPINNNQIKTLEKETDKRIEEISRDKVESKYLIEQAKQKDICLLSGGDPLIATTHNTLIEKAKKENIKTNVIHNSSIYTAAPGKAGLQIYKFGKTATLVNPRPNYKPTSSLNIIKRNKEEGLHTLVLLDTEPGPMTAKKALEILSGIDNFTKAIVLSRLGYPNEKITYGKIEDLKTQDLGKPLFTIIVPGELHEREEKYLNLL